MIRAPRSLAGHLAPVFLVKLAVLIFLWAMFVRPFHQDVSVDRMSAHIGAANPPQGATR